MPGPDHGWKKPSTRAEQARVLRRLRDGLLHKFIYSLDRSVPFTIAFDEEADKLDHRAVHVQWHSVPAPSWSNEFGSVGTGCLIRYRVPKTDVLADGAMLQVGGVILPLKDFDQVSKRYPVIRSHHGVLVYLETRYFLTAQALKQFAKAGAPQEEPIRPESYIKDSRAAWHTVPEWVWRAIVSRMVRVLAPKRELIKRLRSRELQKLSEGMDPSRLTQDDRDK